MIFALILWAMVILSCIAVAITVFLVALEDRKYTAGNHPDVWARYALSTLMLSLSVLCIYLTSYIFIHQ